MSKPKPENVEVNTAELESLLAELRKENEKLLLVINEEKEKTLRAQAEMQNFKRRKEEETSYMMKYAGETILTSLLPTIDNFERALKSEELREDLTDEVSQYLSGFKMIYTTLVGLLNQAEVKEIAASGVEFDPNYHQAVITEKDENKPPGVILEVLQKGYLYKDKVIRPAMVKVNE